MKENRDYEIVLRMIEHCTRIQEILKRFGDSFETFSQDSAYQDAVNMNLFQVGELSNQLSERLRNSRSDIPWHRMYGIRNIIAHAYVIVDMETIWLTIKNNIPMLVGQLSDCLDSLKR